MAKQKVAKITISVPTSLLEVADRLAAENSSSRSGVIASLLEKEEKSRIQALMEEGYRDVAEESRRIADQAFPDVSHLLRQSARWDD